MEEEASGEGGGVAGARGAVGVGGREVGRVRRRDGDWKGREPRPQAGSGLRRLGSVWMAWPESNETESGCGGWVLGFAFLEAVFGFVRWLIFAV